jgi:hypothetical protein
MPVVRIDALCECEGCQKRFGVEVEIASVLKDFDDFEALVREEIRNGNANCYTWGVRGRQTVDRMALSYQATIQADLMLCDVCSKKCDDLPIEGNLTLEQVHQAILGYEGEDDDIDDEDEGD